MMAGSWFIIRKSDGELMFETFNSKLVKALNAEKYVAETALNYLSAQNHSIQLHDIMTNEWWTK